MSLSKGTSLFKLLGMTFFNPFLLNCHVLFLEDKIPPVGILSLSEFTLALGILITFIQPNNVKSFKRKAAFIISVPLLLAVIISHFGGFVFMSLPVTVQTVLVSVVIVGTIVLINSHGYNEIRLMTSLVLWLISVLLRLFEPQMYMKQVITIFKLAAFASFFYYFYSAIYNGFISKISESVKLKESMEKSLNLEVKRRVFEIERSNERLLEISKTDLLTKAFNKITILNIIERLINSKKEGTFSILMFDIDNFKTINDSLGHVTGDLCLKTLAQVASGNIREVDFLGRYGGDEFIIVLPSLTTNEAKYVAERFQNKVNEMSNPKLTVSIGIATYPQDGHTVKELISAADMGLYKSKSRGKNAISHISLF